MAGVKLARQFEVLFEIEGGSIPTEWGTGKIPPSP